MTRCAIQAKAAARRALRCRQPERGVGCDREPLYHGCLRQSLGRAHRPARQQLACREEFFWFQPRRSLAINHRRRLPVVDGGDLAGRAQDP